MWHDKFLYVSNQRLEILPDIMFCALQFLSLSYSKNAHVMIIMTNVWFWHICNTHTHKWLCIRRSYFWVGVEEYFVRLNHWWWYYCLHTLIISVHLLLGESPSYYEFLVQKLAITTLESICFGVSINRYVKNDIGDCTTWGWCRIKFYRDYLTLWFFITTALWYVWPQRIACYDCLAIFLRCT